MCQIRFNVTVLAVLFDNILLNPFQYECISSEGTYGRGMEFMTDVTFLVILITFLLCVFQCCQLLR